MLGRASIWHWKLWPGFARETPQRGDLGGGMAHPSRKIFDFSQRNRVYTASDSVKKGFSHKSALLLKTLDLPLIIYSLSLQASK
jgi:hypothetical protein